MLIWTLQIAITSTVIIILVHHLINFFKSTLTVPKVKDLVNIPTEKYENMFKIINKNQSDGVNNDYTLIDLLPTTTTNTENTMKNELKNFLKSQLKN